MPKMRAITDEMKSTAGRIGDNISLMQDKQEKIKKSFQTILVHFGSTPKVMSSLHLANVQNGYSNSRKTLMDYHTFLKNAAETYELTDAQIAKWADMMQEKKGVDIYNYNPPTIVPEGGWDVSNGWDSVGETFPNNRPDFTAKQYDIYVNANKYIGPDWYADHPNTKQYDVNGVKHINCLSYARQRALEVNNLEQYKAYPESGSGTEIRSNSVAYFHNSNNDFTHAVYIEYYDEATQTVYFTEGNWGSEPDGGLKTMSLEKFNSRNGWFVANYDYYPPE